VEVLTGSSIQKFLPENLPSTRERVPDLIGVLANGRPLHLELMGYNDPWIGERMYDVRGYFRHANRGMPPLKQVVLYVGKGPVQMPDQIEEEDLILRYAVVDIRRYSAAPFLASDSIADILIGVLCDGGDTREYVVAALRRIAGLESVTEIRDAVQKFLILSSKRGLRETVLEESRIMPFTIEKGDDPSLDLVWDEAEQAGQRKGEIAFMRKYMERRFGPLPEWAKDRLSSATHEMLDVWLSRLDTATTLEQILR